MLRLRALIICINKVDDFTGKINTFLPDNQVFVSRPALFFYPIGYLCNSILFFHQLRSPRRVAEWDQPLAKSYPPLYRIHKGLLNAVEEQYADEENDDHGYEAVTQHGPTEASPADEGMPESFYDGRDGVYVGNPAPILGNGWDGVNDWRGVHPQLDAKGDQEAQVAIFCGQGGDDDAKAESQAGHQQDQQWKKQGIFCDLNIRASADEVNHKAEE